MPNHTLTALTTALIGILFLINSLFFVLWIVNCFLELNDQGQSPFIYIFIVESCLSTVNTVIAFQGIMMRKINFLLFYSIFSLVFFFIIMVSTISYFIQGKADWEFEMFTTLLFFKLFFEIIRVISSVCTCFLTHKIKKETTVAPLSFINEGLTADLYKNIIDQSQNPQDPKLKDAFVKLARDSVIRTSLGASQSNNSNE